ncbi:MAG: ArgE/DapE family deacylase [Bacillota bacterium]
MSDHRDVLDYIDAHRDELYAVLQKLVSFETPNPPGGNEKAAQDWVAASLKDLGMEVDVFDALPGRPNAVGVLRGQGGGKTIVLNGHLDVAEVLLPESWSHPPFGGEIAGDRMYGRGTSDMKSGLAGFIFALRALKAIGHKLKGDVIVQSVMGEERGEPGTVACLERGYGGDFAIVGECARGRDVFVTSIGVMNVAVRVKAPYSQHLVARRLFNNTGGDLEGANCLEKTATVIVPALLNLERHWANYKSHPHLPPGQAMINTFAIHGGGNMAVIPSSCELLATVFSLPNEKVEDVRREFEEHVLAAAKADPWLRKYPPEIEWLPAADPAEFRPCRTDPNDPNVRALAAAIETVRGEPARITGRGAIVDGGWFAERGIPVVVYGPGDVSHIHCVDEYIELADLRDFTKSIALFLLRWSGAA